MQHLRQSLTVSAEKVLDPHDVLIGCGLQSGMHIADFGCGNGQFTIPAAHIVGARGSVRAIDLNADVLRGVDSQAKSDGLANVEIITADLENYGSTNIAEGILDAVLMISNHSNSEAQHNMMREASRILKKGGKIFLIEWLDGNTIPFAPAISARVSRETTIVNANSLGLTVVDEFRPGRYHDGLKLQK